MTEKPSLRPLDFQPVTHQGQPMWLLRDPQRLSESQLMVPAPLAQMLLFCDGQHTVDEIHAAFSRYVGGDVDYEVITNALAQLDEACLLENERSRKARRKLLEAYRAQSNRPPALADLSYPGDPERLSNLFQQFGAGDDLNQWNGWQGRGIISPHIDYQRGGAVYAKVWQRAKPALLDADLVMILGTDHNGSAGAITLTRQPYATPFGILPTDVGLIEKIAQSIGLENAFAEELHHQREHSVELSAVWLHHIFKQAGVPPCPMVPVLCGSYHQFVMSGTHPADDPLIRKTIETLKRETAGKKVLIVASVDLAHVGPAFNDDFVMDASRRDQLAQSDSSLVQAILGGDADAFYAQVSAVQNRNRICGLSSIDIMLRYLGGANGVEVAYDHCDADTKGDSLVSICGLLLT